jgi:hypothetical protein
MDINWQKLIDIVLAEVKYKTRNRFSFCEDLVSITVAEVLCHAVGKHSSGKIVTQKRLEKYSRNHVINAIRKIEKQFRRQKTFELDKYIEYLDEYLPVFDSVLPVAEFPFEGIPGISKVDRAIISGLLAGDTRQILLKKKVVKSEYELRNRIHSLKNNYPLIKYFREWLHR